MKGLLARLRVVLAICLAVLWFCGVSQAGNTIEDLVQPDLLAEPHKKLEADCSTCHKAFKKAAQSELCADCHKPIKKDIAAGTGFHGKDSLVRKSECFSCHAEHKGRSFKQAHFTPITFDHAKTDYPLDGKHVHVDCDGCHRQGKKFAEAPQACSNCHAEDQPHRGNLGKECQSCHNTSNWRKVAAFDHNRTRYPLKGAHAKTSCYACHVGEVYKGLTTTCFDCHGMQDVHEARLGRDCVACHTVEDWKHVRFDHGKFTKFALSGAHARAGCAGCHGEKLTSKLPTGCYDCHKGQDAHLGQLGKDCADCHKTTAWRKDVIFDHALTSFPLLGQHIAVACESCHASAAFKDAKTTCFACHQADDVHEGRFTVKCESCHSAQSWRRVGFNHNRDTKFKLTGVHAKVGCNGCHTQKRAMSAALPVDCYSCHHAQDVHRGAFGRDCANCHSTVTFKNAVIRK